MSDDCTECVRLYHRFLEDIRFDIPVRTAVAVADATPLYFAPGASWRYTNTGYDVLGLIVERVTNEPLEKTLGRGSFNH